MGNELKLEHFVLDKVGLDLYIPNQPYFKPNTITAFVANSIEIPNGAIVIEQGAGIGPISILLAKKYPNLSHMYSVEKKEYQFRALKRNIEHYNLEDKLTPQLGDLFKPIPYNLKADIIFSDASGMSEYWGRNMETNGESWYPKGIETGGEDGAEVLCNFIAQSIHHLKQNGEVYFTIVPNFSDTKRIIETARKNYKQVEPFKQKEIGLTTEQRQTIDAAANKLYQDIEKRGSRGTWICEIWKATNPINNPHQ